MANNCWLQRSPLEMALLLILTMAVPFLLAMIITYGLILFQGCPRCSIHCHIHCKSMTRQYLSGVFNYSHKIPLSFQINPNISLSNLKEKYEVCSESLIDKSNSQVDYSVVASLSEDVYIDSLSYQRYLCAATIITFKWILSSSTCIKRENRVSSGVYRIFVRAGSNYWIKMGTEHEIRNVVIADSDSPYTLAAIELQIPFPKSLSIRPVVLSLTSLYADYRSAQIYGWKSNDSLPLRYRKKYATMLALSVIVSKDDQCKRFIGSNPNLFCAMTVLPEEAPYVYFKGSPLIIEKVLIGVVVGGVCNTNNNSTIYFVYEVNKVISWLKQVTNVYVELA